MDNHSQLIRRHKLQYKRACNTALIAPFFFPESPVSPGNLGKRAHLSHCHAERPLPSCPQTHDEVRRCKEQIVTEQVLLDATIPCPARLEQPLHNEERMLHLAADGSFLVLDLSVPIHSFVFFRHAVLRESLGNAVVHV